MLLELHIPAHYRVILKAAIFGICLVFLVTSLLLNLNAYFMDLPYWSISHEPQSNPKLSCLTINTDFQRAMELQALGIARLRYISGKINLKATWELIPRHFNEIWHRQLEALDVLRLQSDGEEQKYFLKFSSQIERPYACNIVTLGVGHSIWAELNLSKIYPECHFLAVDPASDINAELVEKELGGDFLKAAIGGETNEKGLTNVWEKDVETKGVQQRMVPQLGIFDFLRTHHNSLNPVDLLLIDVEGAEFGILEQLVG